MADVHCERTIHETNKVGAGSSGVCMADFIDAGLLGFGIEITALRVEGVPINSFSCRRQTCSIRSRHISFRIER